MVQEKEILREEEPKQNGFFEVAEAEAKKKVITEIIEEVEEIEETKEVYNQQFYD